MKICFTVQCAISGSIQRKKYGPEDACPYKISKNEIESKSYTQLKEDSESFSCLLRIWESRASISRLSE